MSLPFHLSPDPMPLREALRGLRHVLRRGGGSLRETGLTDSLPQPAAQIAGKVFDTADMLARRMDDAASDLAKTVLGGQEKPAERLRDMVARDDAAARFGAALYTALRAVLNRLGATDAFISEAVARKAFERHAAAPLDVAALTLALVEARVVRGVDADAVTRIAPAMVEPVSVFAVMLWLQSDRSDAENEAVLIAACDLSVAVAGDIAAACGTGDAARLGRIHAELLAHV